MKHDEKNGTYETEEGLVLRPKIPSWLQTYLLAQGIAAILWGARLDTTVGYIAQAQEDLKKAASQSAQARSLLEERVRHIESTRFKSEDAEALRREFTTTLNNGLESQARDIGRLERTLERVENAVFQFTRRAPTNTETK